MTKKHFSYAFLGLLVGVLMSTSVQYLVAWTAPTDAPPNANVLPPITAGSLATYQTRGGGLGLTGSVNVSNAGGQDNRVSAPKVCINNDGSDTNCITDWSDISGSTVAPGAYAGTYVLYTGGGCYLKNRFSNACSCPSGFSSHYVMTIDNSSNSYNLFDCWGS
ncbi:MAG: hypothetical protein H6780_02390 [Candidatus Nomurabacteria bacterium]|nr:MAG: hypothetical protein H6780_02390 [Candidatus Nomurabacteria bacterium]